MPDINIPAPDLQVDFAFALGRIRETYLQEALVKTVKDIDLRLLDEQLAKYVPQKSLKAMAQHGLRGELVFAVPCLIEKNPMLLGYYRLLLGFSQKVFYSTEFGLSGFKNFEEKGVIRSIYLKELPALCKALVSCACGLVDGIGSGRISMGLLDDLTLLTVGPQLRGGANVKKGSVGIIQVFEIIHAIVKHAAVSANAGKIKMKGSSACRVGENWWEKRIAPAVIKGGTLFPSLKNLS